MFGIDFPIGMDDVINRAADVLDPSHLTSGNLLESMSSPWATLIPPLGLLPLFSGDDSEGDLPQAQIPIATAGAATEQTNQPVIVNIPEQKADQITIHGANEGMNYSPQYTSNTMSYTDISNIFNSPGAQVSKRADLSQIPTQRTDPIMVQPQTYTLTPQIDWSNYLPTNQTADTRAQAEAKASAEKVTGTNMLWVAVIAALGLIAYKFIVPKKRR